MCTRKAATTWSYLAGAATCSGNAYLYGIRDPTANRRHAARMGGADRDFEFQRCTEWARACREPGPRAKATIPHYAPVGGIATFSLISFAGCSRTRQQSFVPLADESLSDDQILADPVAKIEAVGGTRTLQPLPAALSAERATARGSTSTTAELERVAEAVAAPPGSSARERAAAGG